MLQNHSLIKNTFLLTASSLLMRFISMAWQVWLVGKIGEDGIGLYQLILSLGALAVTVAVSGIRFTTTRLVSEQLGKSSGKNVKSAMKYCLFYGFVFGMTSFLVLFFCAEAMGFLWLSDARTVKSLQWLALSLPFLSVSTVISGYFTAVKRVWKSVAVQVAGELFKIAVTVLLLRSYQMGDMEKACASIFAGGAAADAMAAMVLLLLFFEDSKSFSGKAQRQPSIRNRMLDIALPLAAASYARSGLSTLQHILVPKGLKASGLSSVSALAAYGVIQGMALPVVLFPSCLMLALAEMLVPELTHTQVSGNRNAIRNLTGEILEKTFLFASAVAGLFFFLGDNFGAVLYDSAEAGKYIKAFALLCPVMYMDMITDGCLKGLGEMMFCMIVNIADAGLSALLVYLLLPAYGIRAYIGMIFFTECFNFGLSLFRLKKVAGLSFHPGFILKALAASGLAFAAARALNIKISAGSSVPTLIISVVFGLIIYVGLALSALRRQ